MAYNSVEEIFDEYIGGEWNGNMIEAVNEHYKKKYLALVPEKMIFRKHPLAHNSSYVNGFNASIDEMTNNINQFNSKGDSDE